jgi:hypothetical protein
MEVLRLLDNLTPDHDFDDVAGAWDLLEAVKEATEGRFYREGPLKEFLLGADVGALVSALNALAEEEGRWPDYDADEWDANNWQKENKVITKKTPTLPLRDPASRPELACVVAAGLLAASPDYYGQVDFSEPEAPREQLAQEALAVVDEIFAVAKTPEGEQDDQGDQAE